MRDALKAMQVKADKFKLAMTPVGEVITESTTFTEQQMKATEEALRAAAEAEYYVNKVSGLVYAMQESLKTLRLELATLDGVVEDQRNKLIEDVSTYMVDLDESDLK